MRNRDRHKKREKEKGRRREKEGDTECERVGRIINLWQSLWPHSGHIKAVRVVVGVVVVAVFVGVTQH